MTKNLLVLKASAGSGKTYSLVREYLRIALAGPGSSGYRSILAITFTNAAAAEMKDRVLLKLQGFAEGKGNSAFDEKLFNDLVNDLKLDPVELQARSGAMFRHMLHHYGLVSILTIDSFTHKLLRSFARELRLSGDFTISMDIDAFNNEIVDRCLALVGEDKTLTEYLMQFSLDNFEEEKNWNIRGQLVQFVKLLQQEETGKYLPLFSDWSLKDFTTARNASIEFIKKFEHEITSIANEGKRMIFESGIPENDFSNRAALPSYFRKIADLHFVYPTPTLEKSIRDNKHVASKPISPDSKSRISEIVPLLVPLVEKIVSLLNSHGRIYTIHQAIVRGIYPTGLLSMLASIGNDIRAEKNMLLISDFQQQIAEIIQDNDAPFIFEKAGERYRHILFDEFQDTSELQWKNFLPLMANALAEGNFNLIVGDSKQALYRWRNGNVEQFIHLPDIPRDDNGMKSLFESSFGEKSLSINYRSAKSIVDFNNKLYENVSDYALRFRSVYDGVKQEASGTNEGYVCVTNIYSPDHASDKQILEEIYQTVQQCISDGYNYGDIAILTRKKDKEAGPIAQYLNERNIAVQTSESFLLTNSAKIRSIIYYLRCLLSPSDQASRVLLAESLISLYPEKIPYPVHEKYSSGYRSTYVFRLEQFLSDHFPEIKLITSQQRSLYELVQLQISGFGFAMDDYLENLLERIHIEKSSSIAAFLGWWEQHCNVLFIAPSAGENAVRVMTVHKSKGLQFPVVIYPRYQSPEQHDKIWINTTDVSSLPSALVNYKKPDVFSPPEFNDEREKQDLDDLNVMYVATTRAQERLYMILEGSGEKTTSTHLNIHVVNYLRKAYPENNTGRWEFGDPHSPPTEKQKNTVNAEHLEVPLLKISPDPAPENVVPLWREDSFRIHGRIVHEALASHEPGDDLELFRTRLNKKLKQYDASDHSFVFAWKVLQSEKFSRWFLKGLHVRNEAEIVTGEGTILRPDRVVFFDDHIEIVDFKTGTKREKYHDQVLQYMKHVSEIENLPVKGFIAYTDTFEVEEVS